MRSILSRLAVVLLLPIFLMSSADNIFSYVWCIGDGGHGEIETVTVSGCDDTRDKIINYGKQSDILEEISNSCFDVALEHGDAFFHKKLRKVPNVSFTVENPIIFTQSIILSSRLVVGNLASLPPPRLSQTIIAHRTVVLLT